MPGRPAGWRRCWRVTPTWRGGSRHWPRPRPRAWPARHPGRSAPTSRSDPRARRSSSTSTSKRSSGDAGRANVSDDVTYTFAGVAKILEISESKLRYWSQVGFVGPSVRRGGKQVFNFQDLVSVKAAKE